MMARRGSSGVVEQLAEGERAGVGVVDGEVGEGAADVGAGEVARHVARLTPTRPRPSPGGEGFLGLGRGSQAVDLVGRFFGDQPGFEIGGRARSRCLGSPKPPPPG